MKIVVDADMHSKALAEDVTSGSLVENQFQIWALPRVFDQ